MKQYPFLIFFMQLIYQCAGAQTQPYGKIDTADLKMTSCDFEKDANAMVLFDKAEVVYRDDRITMQRHKRIKILNDKGKDEANIRIEFYGGDYDEEISHIQAETINLNHTIVEYTSVDPKLIYTQIIDKHSKAIIFTFPNARPGSVLEFTYTWETSFSNNYPSWTFQSHVPTRYSEIDAGFNKGYSFTNITRFYQPLAKDTIITNSKNNDKIHIWALSNISSYKTEPYMDFPNDYQDVIVFRKNNYLRMWQFVIGNMLEDVDYGFQLRRNLANEDRILNRAQALTGPAKKIAFIFDTVKNLIKWNKNDNWFAIDGVKTAWNKKIGSATEINMILYDLLKKAGIDVKLLGLSTRNIGRLILDFPSAAALNRTVVYYPVDSTKYYVLDASNPYNSYKNIPADLMGLDALLIDPDKKEYKSLTINTGPANEAIFINGQINTDGRLEGTAQVSSSAYCREQHLDRYNMLGRQKFMYQLESEYKSLKITSIKLDNIEQDTLPLVQNYSFHYQLTEPDGDYMYFTPNLFSGFENNPFLSDKRVSNINLGCLFSYSINGRYTIPAGYKIDALPKSTIVKMPDDNIVFNRLVAAEDGVISIRYTINFGKALFGADEYKGLHDFYKKLYEMLNEQIVLKKS